MKTSRQDTIVMVMVEKRSGETRRKRSKQVRYVYNRDVYLVFEAYLSEEGSDCRRRFAFLSTNNNDHTGEQSDGQAQKRVV